MKGYFCPVCKKGEFSSMVISEEIKSEEGCTSQMVTVIKDCKLVSSRHTLSLTCAKCGTEFTIHPIDYIAYITKNQPSPVDVERARKITAELIKEHIKSA